jgi:hypothetical protein
LARGKLFLNEAWEGSMKILIRLFDPKSEKEQLFQVEARMLNEMTNPSKAYVVLDGKEYLIEVDLS